MTTVRGYFPRTLADFDRLPVPYTMDPSKICAVEEHPDYSDLKYLRRRMEIAELALHHTPGTAIQRVEYQPWENEVWALSWSQLRQLHSTLACSAYNRTFEILALPPNEIPHLQDVSTRLQQITGWQLRPAAGLVSARHFLAALAFRCFFCTQFVRHPSRVSYTPEPDVIHDLIGHAPLLADPEFAAFSQTIGLASLGSSDEELLQLSRCYWFSVEFGLTVDHDGEVRSYGAGLLSSAGELLHALDRNTNRPRPLWLPFDPIIAGKMDYPVSTLQPVYFVAQSFKEAQHQVCSYAKGFLYDLEWSLDERLQPVFPLPSLSEKPN